MPKRSFEIRLRATVEVGSSAETLLEFLDNKEATPYPKLEMLMMAAETLWLPLAYKYKQRSPEEVLQTMYDVIYRWQRHEQYLQNKTGVRVICHQLDSIHLKANQALPAEVTKPLTITGALTSTMEGETTEVEKPAVAKPYNPFGDTIISTQPN